MEHIHGDAETRAEDGTVHSEVHLRSGGSETSGDESTLHLLGGIVRGATADSLYTSTNKVREAIRGIDDRTRIFTLARERPLTTLGAAFGESSDATDYMKALVRSAIGWSPGPALGSKRCEWMEDAAFASACAGDPITSTSELG